MPGKTPSGKELSVPVPVGFDVEVNNNVVTITSQGKNNLSYVWIPVNEEFNTKDFSEQGIAQMNASLKQAYGIADRTQEEILNYTKDPTDTVEFKSWVKARNMKKIISLAVDELIAFANSKGGTVYLA